VLTPQASQAYRTSEASKALGVEGGQRCLALGTRGLTEASDKSARLAHVGRISRAKRRGKGAKPQDDHTTAADSISELDSMTNDLFIDDNFNVDNLIYNEDTGTLHEPYTDSYPPLDPTGCFSTVHSHSGGGQTSDGAYYGYTSQPSQRHQYSQISHYSWSPNPSDTLATFPSDFPNQSMNYRLDNTYPANLDHDRDGRW
jgi:hypothetical protein